MKLRKLHYSWVIVVISAILIAVQHIIMYTRGVFLIPLTTEFNWNRAAVSGAFSTAMLISAPLAIVVGRLSDKYGPRIPVTVNGLLIGIGLLWMSQINSLWQVYVIWALLIGVGTRCGYVPIVSAIPRWFVSKRGLAVGIAIAGVSLGGITWPPLAQRLISTYGWQQAYSVLGLITLIIIIPLAQFLKHSPQRIGLKPYGEDETTKTKESSVSTTGGLSLTQAVRTGRFWIFGLIQLCFWSCYGIIMVHIIPSAIDLEISATAAASILSIIAGVSIISRLSTGSISDRIGMKLSLSAYLIMAALAFIWLLFATETWMFYIFAIILGLAYGGYVSLETLIPAGLFGVGSLGGILAAMLLFGTAGMAIGAPLAGAIFDITGSYHPAFSICAILCAVAIILGFILLRHSGQRNPASSD